MFAEVVALCLSSWINGNFSLITPPNITPHLFSLFLPSGTLLIHLFKFPARIQYFRQSRLHARWGVPILSFLRDLGLWLPYCQLAMVMASNLSALFRHTKIPIVYMLHQSPTSLIYCLIIFIFLTVYSDTGRISYMNLLICWVCFPWHQVFCLLSLLSSSKMW